MKYAVLHGPLDLRLAEKPVPDVKPGHVLVKIAACGICGTDLLIYQGRTSVHYPYSSGHECVGVVARAGEEIFHLRPGDRVAIDPNYDCGFCYYCCRGYPHLCENQKTLKVKSNGGFAEYIALPARLAHKIPPDMPFEHAVLIESLSCAIHIMEETSIRMDDGVVIVGGGTMGLLLLQLAKMRGARAVVLSEPSEFKRQIALKLGADLVIDPRAENLADRCREYFEHGANVLIDGVGLPSLLEEVHTMLARKGTLVLTGLGPEDHKAAVYPFRLTKDEITIKGAFLNPFAFDRAIALASKLVLADLITGIYPLEKITEAFADALKSHHVKIAVRPGPTAE